MQIRRVHDEESRRAALRDIERLWNAAPGTEERETVRVLADLVELYESRHFAVPEADPIEVLEFAISDMGRSQKELGHILGSSSRASEVMNRKRALTIEMIDKISRAWRIPVAALAKPYRLAPSERLPRRSQKNSRQSA
ncbi:MAG TPA: transcriptional regulator [Beijerinckiaceae bacterium]|jgi:HTH-type transcriptional regulator/antitoxin HigA|nr:putative transcription regulator with domain protein [Microvirga sp.]HZB37787.1 transcriptional regulator [Beijerinckiaceae bacterium]